MLAGSLPKNGNESINSIHFLPQPPCRLLGSCMLSSPVMCNSWWPHGLYPTRLLCPWDSPGKTTEWVAIPLPEDLPGPGTEPISLMSPAFQAESLSAEPSGKPATRTDLGPKGEWQPYGEAEGQKCQVAWKNWPAVNLTTVNSQARTEYSQQTGVFWWGLVTICTVTSLSHWQTSQSKCKT